MLRSLFGVLLSASLLIPGATAAEPQSAPNLDTVVDTFIGTQDEGNTFPGASAPFGLIQISPIGSHYAGWQYTDKTIRGFGGQILLHPPRFTRIAIWLGNGRQLVITAPEASGDGLQYVRGVSVNGHPQDRAWTSWDALRNGGRIDFTLTTNPPPAGWGTSPATLPPSRTGPASDQRRGHRCCLALSAMARSNDHRT